MQDYRITVDRLVGAQRSLRADQAAVIDPGRCQLTYGQLDADADMLAGRLSSLGARKGSRIAAILPNCAEYCVLFVAAAKLGAMLVAVNNRYREDEFLHTLTDCRPAVIVVDSDIDREMLSRLRAELERSRDGSAVPVQLVGASGSYLRPGQWAGPEEGGSPSPGGAGAAEDELLVIYTSGTTGRPKGAVLSHLSILASAYGYAERLGVLEGDRIAVFTPMFHAGGMINGVATAFLRGACAVLNKRFEHTRAVEIMDRYEVSVYLAVPTMLEAHREAKGEMPALKHLRTVVTGGSAVYPGLYHHAKALFGQDLRFHLVYGLTEANMAVVSEPIEHPGDAEWMPVGRSTEPFEVRAGSGPEEIGEIRIKGDGVFLGYWRNEAATKETFDAQGWLRSGDLGWIDDEGMLTIVGRSKEMYIRGGLNVYPAEVERVLHEHPQISYAAVIGLPDQKYGEVGRAYVVPDDGAEIDEDGIREYVSSRLSTYKVPDSVMIRAELPLTPFGKIWKAKLKEEAQ